MNVLLILIPVSVVLMGIAIWAFFWATDNGQFDDLETPAIAVLVDDREPDSGACGSPGPDPFVQGSRAKAQPGTEPAPQRRSQDPV